VNFLSQVVADPQVLSRGAIAEHEHPTAGLYSAVQAPWRLGSSGRGAAQPPPVLGAHTAEVLAEAGLTADEVAALVAEGVAWDADGELRS
jgi:crotonobetainyl-CoA:carnitine CoA-transferase CaiB-like acyl-CoA transferase